MNCIVEPDHRISLDDGVDQGQDLLLHTQDQVGQHTHTNCGKNIF